MLGSCLCGSVKFQLNKKALKLYQCHCKLCRKQSGTFSNAATIIPEDDFSFTKGQELVTHWKKDTGFTSDFCSLCGSPVPNVLRDTSYVWIPAGLLDNDVNAEIISHIFMNSKATWEKESSSVDYHEEFPGFELHIERLNAE